MAESGAPIFESLDKKNFAGIGVASRRRLQQQLPQNQRQDVSPILLSYKDHRDITIPQSQFLPKHDQDTSMYGAQSRLSCGRFPRFAKVVNFSLPLTPAPSSMSYQTQDMPAARASPALSTEPSLKPYRQSGLDALDMAFWSGDGFYSDDEDDPMTYASQNMLAQKRQLQCTKPLPDVHDAENHLPLSILDEYLRDAVEPMAECQQKDSAALLHEECESQLRSLRCKSQLVMCNDPSVVRVQDTGITGMFRKTSKGECYHPTCMVCAYSDAASGPCLLQLTDYFFMNKKMYCEEHARQVAQSLSSR
ncbi:hypothetical protein MARU1_000868 [Malassezia arunalokei]|uniref:Uncharacterized protein n=1 Tax=Malassezia arunalokei TaxID=1514897 RepID=A0AAJ6CKY4_9BASI|nr:hypothetical protein MARU1_000868 [Malassezia arunalokei]